MVLPQSIEDIVEFHPLEDVVLTVLRNRLPDIPIQSQIQDKQVAPFVLIYRAPGRSGWRGDQRFYDAGWLNVEAICVGVDADRDAAILSEAVRVSLRDAWLENDVVPGVGSVSYVDMQIEPHNTPDWATATGPVQYADLPTDFVRYETVYRVWIRPPRTHRK